LAIVNNETRNSWDKSNGQFQRFLLM